MVLLQIFSREVSIYFILAGKKAGREHMPKRGRQEKMLPSLGHLAQGLSGFCSRNPGRE